MNGVRTKTLVVIGTDCTRSCKFNYHTITKAPLILYTSTRYHDRKTNEYKTVSKILYFLILVAYINVRKKQRVNHVWTIQRHRKHIGLTRHRTKTNKTKNTTQKTKKRSDRDPTKKSGVNSKGKQFLLLIRHPPCQVR